MKKTFLFLFVFLSLALQAADYTIYPIPHSLVMQTGKLQFSASRSVQINRDASIDEATLKRAESVLRDGGFTIEPEEADVMPDFTLYLGTIGAGGAAEQVWCNDLSLDKNSLLVSGKFDRHGLAITSKNIVILGEHTNAVFYGLASLEQILEQADEDGSLPAVLIQDYADQQNRGLVEGYYGYPYSVSVKKDLMRFMMRYKMNTYLYGAKSDPYHSQSWKDAYPTTISVQQEKNGWLTQDMVSDIAATSEATKVNFIWAIHPGNNFLGSSTVISDIMSKFQKMHQLGVRQFAVFVDDVSIPSSDADMQLNAERVTNLQKSIEERWNGEGALATDTVRPLHFVPQIYCSSFASSEDQRKRFMSALGKTPSYVTVYTTGQGVWTVPNSEHMQNMNNELGRDMAWWWNYPCNDNADGQIYTMDMYSNFYDLPSVNGSSRMPSNLTHTVGVVANPMQEGEVAKTSLFSVADYAWNNGGFNNENSWESSFGPLISKADVREAYRFLTRYLRWNEPSTLQTLISNYKSSLSKGIPADDKLRELFTTIVGNCDVVEQLKESDVEGDRLLYTDLRPWLWKLRDDAKVLLGLLDVASNTGDASQRWEAYLACLDQIDSLQHSTDYTAYALEGMGNSISVSKRQAQVSQLYLEPFITYMKANALQGCFTDQRQEAATYITNRPNFKPSVATNATTHMVSISANGRPYEPGEYVGIKLAQATRLESIIVADTLLTNHCVMWSGDGKQWTRLTLGQPTPDVPIRYVIVINEKQTVNSYRVPSGTLKLALPQQTTIASVEIPTDEGVWQNHVKDYIIDGDYTTFCTLNRNQKSTDTYTVDLGKVETIHDVRICMGTTNGDYMTEGRVQVSEDGEKWFALRVKGVDNSFTYTLDMPQNVRYSDDMTYCDFDGRLLQARYVRLALRTANTSKWLRLYEIEVNRNYQLSSYRSLCTDAEGASLDEAVDGDGSSYVPTSVQWPVVYHLEEMADVSHVDVFCMPGLGGGATVSVTEDGQTWTPLTTLTSAWQRLDLSAYPHAVAIMLQPDSSAGESSLPRIYQMVAGYTDSTLPILTGIKTLQGTCVQTDKMYNLQGIEMNSATHRGVYILGGRKVLK